MGAAPATSLFCAGNRGAILNSQYQLDRVFITVWRAAIAYGDRDAKKEQREYGTCWEDKREEVSEQQNSLFLFISTQHDSFLQGAIIRGVCQYFGVPLMITPWRVERCLVDINKNRLLCCSLDDDLPLILNFFYFSRSVPPWSRVFFERIINSHSSS